MAVRIFRDLMPDLETTDPSTDVYVTLGTGLSDIIGQFLANSQF